VKQKQLQFAARKVYHFGDGSMADDIPPVNAKENGRIQLFTKGIKGIIDHIISLICGMQIGPFFEALEIEELIDKRIFFFTTCRFL